MTEEDNQPERDKDGLPIIKIPTLEKKLEAAIEHTKDIPDIKKLIDEGKKVFIDTDTGEVRILNDDDEE